MEKSVYYAGLVKKAQLGDKTCLEALTEVAEERMRADVYRLTLEYELTEEIVQETLLEMFKILRELKDPDKFWPWLYKIALNKIRLYHRTEKRRKTLITSAVANNGVKKDSDEAMPEILSRELKEIIFAAMRRLKPEHRAVLTMRCYREMRYADIAESMGCSEFAAKMLFIRAKKSLRKHLSRHGFGKGSLLMALILFGQMTAESEAAVASVSLTSTALTVSVPVSIAAFLASKTGVVSLITSGILAVGITVVTLGPEKAAIRSEVKPEKSLQLLTLPSEANKVNKEYWYYFPKGQEGPMMMRLMAGGPNGANYYCQLMQDEQANYYFDSHKNAVYINNCRFWHSDLSVWRLPTDDSRLREFLSLVEGQKEKMAYVSSYRDGLMVVAKPNQTSNSLWTTHHYNVLSEEYFRYNWPAGVRVNDNRDAMHKRGWTYFKITGQINGKDIDGRGRIPFVYAASRRHWPWVILKLGGSIVNEASFAGISRPWMGLHTIDTVRRDAAEKQICFRTKYSQDNTKAEIVLTREKTTLVYIVDLDTDLIDTITFSVGGQTVGRLRFSYPEKTAQVGHEFAQPSATVAYSVQQKSSGMMWLVQLAEGTLEK